MCQAQTATSFKVVTYNLLNFPNPSNNDPLGNDNNRAQSFRTIIESEDADLILIQEMKSQAGADLLRDELNNNGTLGKTYSNTNYIGYGFNNDFLGNMLIYNEDKFNLINQTEYPPTANALTPDNQLTFAPRGTTLYELQIAAEDCTEATSTIYLISLHAKGGNDNADNNEISDRDRRLLSIQDALDLVNTLPANSNIIIGADFNFYADNDNGGTYSEPGYVLMTNNSLPEYFIDPLGGWIRNNNAEASKYTQSTRTSSGEYGNAGIPGGMDDRFDQILFSTAIQNNTAEISYTNNSYKVLGNEGVPTNGNALDGNNPIKQLYHQMSDHFPVFAEFEVNFNPNSDCYNCTGSASIANLPSTTSSPSPITLQGIPSGGSFTGPGVIFNAFNPALAGPGLHQIVYSVTDQYSCEYSSSQNILVLNISYSFINYQLGTVSPE